MQLEPTDPPVPPASQRAPRLAPLRPVGAFGRLARVALGPPVDRALPARVRAQIDAAQDESEILIGWLQLGIVVIFGALYALSPKMAPDVAGLQPAPLALLAYVLFTLARIASAYRGRLPRWLVALSAVADIALLLGLIWSFHIQYGQPPSFYLKIPTLLYVFIFISLRALRFDALYLIVAGVAGAAGWAGMVGYAVLTDDGGMMVTRDYVYYMTNNAILIGAEFDKIVSILMVTAVLAIAIARARRLLERSVAESMAARDMSRFLAPEVVSRVTEAETAFAAGEGEARDAAILFLDIRGFTPLANALSPHDVIRLLTEYQARFTPILRAHGGVIDKFMGDGVMASFGAAQPSLTYARNALEALSACMVEAGRWSKARRDSGLAPIEVVGAVGSGRVIYGAVGDADRLDMTVIGDAVNLAAKLEKHTRRAGEAALASAEAYDLGERQGFRPARPARRLIGEAVEGAPMPMDLVAL